MPRHRHYRVKRFYEIVFALKPTLNEEEVSKKVEDIKKFIERKGGEILYEEEWGLKGFAYRVANFNHGRFFLIQFTTENPQLPNELDFFMRINNDVIRWLNFNIKEQEVINKANA